MRESNGEGVANHAGPKPCVGVRKGDGEASAGVHAGRVLSREISGPARECRTLQGAHAVEKAEGNTGSVAIARRSRALRGRRPRARMESTRAGTGRSQRRLRLEGAADRIVKPQGRRR